MRFLANYIMHGRVQAISTVVSLALLSIVIAPLTLLTTAAVALVTLVQGYREGLLNLVAATVILSLMLELLMGQGIVGLEYTMKFWLPAWFFASVLLYKASLSYTVFIAGIIATLIVVGFYLVTEPAQMWYAMITTELLPMLKEAGMVINQTAETDKAWQFMATMMTGSAVALLMLLHVTSLFIARWWQALLYRPDGFAQEFRQLRFGFFAAVTGLLISAIAVTTANEMAINLFFVVISLFMFQGLAVIHSLVAKCKLGSAWLVGVYIVMFFTLTQGAIGILIVAITGLLDNWVNFRVRLCVDKTDSDMS